jgi:S1/P1 Nuclease
MLKILGKAVFVGFITTFMVFPAIGWDDVGHKITGYIAWQRMSAQARENVIKILRAAPEDSQLGTFYKNYGPEAEDIRKLEYFMFVPTWADVVRDRAFDTRYKKYHKGNWHYDDTFWRQVNGQVEELSGFEEGGQAVPKLVEFDAVIRNSSASNADKAIAIAWILHLGGDIHQPLHTSARVTDTEPKGDQGGNLFLLSPVGTARENQVNLHWFWDSIVGRNVPFKNGMCERDYIEVVAKSLIKKHPFATAQGKLNLGNYGDWQKESFAYNNTVVFSADLKRNEMPSAKYRKNAFKLAESQLALAGYRLGETLNGVFGTVAAK